MDEMPPPPAIFRLFVTQETGNWNGELVAENVEQQGFSWSVRLQAPQVWGHVTLGYRLPFHLALLAAGEATPSGAGAAAGAQYWLDIYPRTTRVRLEALAGTFLQGTFQTDYEFWPQWEVSALYRYRHPGLHTFGAGLGYRL